MATESPATARSRRTRNDLVQAVHDEVARTGSLDVAAITKVAGVSPATFYAHFDTHDDALAAAFGLSLDAVVGVLDQHFSVEALLEHGLESVVDGLVRETLSVFRVEALVMRAAVARIPHHRGMRDTYREREILSREKLTRHIDLGQRAKVLREGDPQDRAISVLVSTQGLNNPLLLGKRPNSAVVDDLCRAINALLAPYQIGKQCSN